MIANYHSHTPRCNHAEGSERAYVEQAVAGSLRVLGFSDHTPYFFDGDYRSRIRMRPEELEDYISVLQNLREEFRDRIELHIGLEA
jgi:histidinol-phosphatase (PHP family)